MRRNSPFVLAAALVAALTLAACGPLAIPPAPTLTSPVHGTSAVDRWSFGTAREVAAVAPCSTDATTISATVDSPGSGVYVRLYSRIGGVDELLQEAELPAGTTTASADVPAGCYLVSITTVSSYCDGSNNDWLPYPCQVVMPPTYRFTYTVTF